MRHEFDPWVQKISWRRACNPLQYSCLENLMDGGAWQATVHRVSKSQTQWKQLSIYTHARKFKIMHVICTLFVRQHCTRTSPAFALQWLFLFTFNPNSTSSHSIFIVGGCLLDSDGSFWPPA